MKVVFHMGISYSVADCHAGSLKLAMGRLGSAVCLEVVLLRSREVVLIGADKVGPS
jgi:hypothetical protein